MRPDELARLSPEHQAFIRRKQRAGDQWKRPKQEPEHFMFGIEFDSRLEVLFALYLEGGKHSRDIEYWHYHPIRIRLAPGLTYTPDFVSLPAAQLDRDSISQRLRVYEVKGSWQSKNARDSKTRLKVAASMFPCWDWFGVTAGDDGWEFEQMSP